MYFSLKKQIYFVLCTAIFYVRLLERTWEERIVKVMTVTGKQNKTEQVFTKTRKYQTNSIGFFNRVIN